MPISRLVNNIVHNDLAAPFTFHVNPSPELLSAGAHLVNDVSLLTSFPDPSRWPNGALIEHTHQRQMMAHLAIVVTTSVDDCERVIGHALLLPAREESWNDLESLSGWLASGRLAELGATAVHPDFQRRGLAKRMREMRMEWVRTHRYVACVSVWDGGNSHAMYRDLPGWTYLGSKMAIYTKRLVHRYVETEALTEVD